MKIIYQVDFDPIKTNADYFFDSRIVGIAYPSDDGKEKFVVSIDEKIVAKTRTILVHYDDGSEDELFDIAHIFRKLIIS